MTLKKLKIVRDKLFYSIIHKLSIDLTEEEKNIIKYYLLEEVFANEYTNSKINKEKIIENCNKMILSPCSPDNKLLFLNITLIELIKQNKLKLENTLCDVQDNDKNLKYCILFSKSLKFIIRFYDDKLYENDECFQFFKNKLNNNFVEITKYLINSSCSLNASLKSPFIQDFFYIFRYEILSEYKNGTLEKKEIYFFKKSLKYFIMRKKKEIIIFKKLFIKNKEVKE